MLQILLRLVKTCLIGKWLLVDLYAFKRLFFRWVMPELSWLWIFQIRQKLIILIRHLQRLTKPFVPKYWRRSLCPELHSTLRPCNGFLILKQILQILSPFVGRFILKAAIIFHWCCCNRTFLQVLRRILNSRLCQFQWGWRFDSKNFTQTLIYAAISKFLWYITVLVQFNKLLVHSLQLFNSFLLFKIL